MNQHPSLNSCIAIWFTRSYATHPSHSGSHLLTRLLARRALIYTLQYMQSTTLHSTRHASRAYREPPPPTCAAPLAPPLRALSTTATAPPRARAQRLSRRLCVRSPSSPRPNAFDRDPLVLRLRLRPERQRLLRLLLRLLSESICGNNDTKRRGKSER